jgi:hypothetical protein
MESVRCYYICIVKKGNNFNESGIIVMLKPKVELVKKSKKKTKLCYSGLPNSRAEFGEFSAEYFYCKYIKPI